MRPPRTIHMLIAMAGCVLILASAVFLLLDSESRSTQPDFARVRLWMLVFVAGIVINQIGVWQLGYKFLPDRRIYLELRAEVDRFIDDVRELNRLTVLGQAAQAAQVVARLHDAIPRMQAAAGVRASAPADAAAAAAPQAPAGG